MITLKLVTCTTRDPIGWATHFYPVVELAGPTIVQWHGADYLVIATDWNTTGEYQLLIVDGGQRVPAVEAVIRELVGDAMFDQLPEMETFDLITLLLRGVDLYRQHAADGVYLTVYSAPIEPLHFADRFLRAYSPDVPVIFRQRAIDAGNQR
jgi:hypothetical protein